MASRLNIKELQLSRRTLQLVILSYVFISMGASLVRSNSIASLYLKRYSNPNHKDVRGDCCDTCFLGFEECENKFTLCIDDIGGSSNNCQYFNRVIYHKDDDNFNFPSVLRSGIRNPILVDFSNYKGGFRLLMTIYDDDDVSADDLVDRYTKDFYITPSRSAQSARTYYYTLTGPGYSWTTIEVKVYCDDNFYGTNCLVHCVPFDNDDDGHYTCDSSTGDKVCLPGYTGTLCKTEINECESSPCQNGGRCTNHLTYYTCECADGTLGERCEINVNECASEPCQNRSTCIDQINGYHCQCEAGYEGNSCSLEVDECASEPCENNATCVDQLNSYTCKCPPGYVGSQCDSNASSLNVIEVIIVIIIIAFVILLVWSCCKAMYRTYERNPIINRVERSIAAVEVVVLEVQ